MDKRYRFSPIKDTQAFDQALIYITGELEKLSKELLGKDLPITTLKVFPHYPEEYDYLYKHIQSLGLAASFNSETSYYAKVDRKILGHDIKFIGVRIVDPYRLHVGCGDYKVEDLEKFKKEINPSPFIRSFREDMLELWHPDFDVLGYIVSSE